MNRILLIGSSHDGPDNLIMNLNSRREFDITYNLPYVQSQSILGESVLTSLHYDTEGLLINFVDDKRNYLYNPQVDNSLNRLTFGQIGGVGYRNVRLEYYPDYGSSDLKTGHSNCLDEGVEAYTCRMGGVVATITPIAGLVFKARYSGKKYNQVKVSCDTNVVTIYGLETEYQSFRVLFTSREDFINKITNAFNDFQIPIYCSACPTSLSNFAAVNLAGGADTTFSSAQVLACLDNLTIPLDVSTVVFLFPLDVDAVNHVKDFAILNQNYQFFIPITDPGGTVATWTSSFNYPEFVSLFYFLGTGENSVDNFVKSRYIAEQAAITLSKNLYHTSLTNLELPITDYKTFTKAELNLITEQGINVPTRRVYKNLCIYKGVTSTKENTTYRIVASTVVSICYPFLLSQVITTRSRLDILKSELQRVLEAGLPLTLKLLDIKLTLTQFELEVDIYVQAEEEVQTIKFALNS